jgi:hypothetical protein
MEQWRKSSYSGHKNDNCVEVAESYRGIKVRDTQSRDLGHLEFPAAEWRAFLFEVESL